VAKKREMIERKLTVADAVSEAFGDLEGLAEEMREAFDNTPESLQSSGVGEARGEAADALENLSEPDAPERLGEREFTFSSFPPPKKQSRSSRRDAAVSLLDAAIQFLQSLEWTEEQKEQDEEAEQLVTEIESLKDDAEAVEFPGMYG
jgi:hypothetical protein